MKTLFKDYLLNFNGVVLSNTTATSNSLFRSYSQPDLVLVDEVIARQAPSTIRTLSLA
ncbi:uncharacterized protein B0J16DRAFT_177530 [Fusarium flagelliforme]|uniref:uncharacterized protein n=1 Tax=Fusarium flagelliforme TaxID=2675880 RepID=UPI001E8D7375|nr:uncharacterized protein B0J16DRAFT_177530 [Fusarium flagelliforme]KAH7179799.1 hypothetical protein B0J16DRAFT_177530 [Fusarium flagelliforme]